MDPVGAGSFFWSKLLSLDIASRPPVSAGGFLWERHRQLFPEPRIDAMQPVLRVVTSCQVVQLIKHDLAIAHRLHVLSAWQLWLSPDPG